MRKSKFILVMMLVVACLYFSSPTKCYGEELIYIPPGAESVHILPSHDAYVDNVNSGTNYGGTVNLYVGDENYNEPAKTCRTYMMFDPDIVPAGSTIISAKLYLRSWGVGPDPDIVVGAHYLSDNSWTEGTITWNNAPTTYNTTASDTETIDSSARWFVWNVTSDLKTAYQANDLLSLVLVSTTEGSHSWCGFSSSEEYTTSFRPYLEIIYDPDGTLIGSGSEGFGTKNGNIAFGGGGGGGGLPPIPLSFFGPGSDPFEGTVCFKAAAPDPTTGLDVIINREEGAFLPDSSPSASVPVEMVALNLVSTSPIRITGHTPYPPESFFDVFVTIKIPAPGLMMITKTHANGGTFQYSITPTLTLRFVPVSPGVEARDMTIPGSVYPDILIVEQSEPYPWLNTTYKETPPGGSDGLYPSGEEPLNANLLYAGGVTGQLALMPPQEVRRFFAIGEEEGWTEALSNGSVRPMTSTEWEEYMESWQYNPKEGVIYPQNTEFRPAELYVYGGDLSGVYPEEPGLVMAWGETNPPEGSNYASAWVYDYAMDPDLSNSTVTITVNPPSKSNIASVSFSMIDNAGLIRSWWWAVPAVIPYDVATTVTIDTSKTGLNATNPPATGYNSAVAFNITNVVSFAADENGTYFPSTAVPPPGQQIPRLWNYWTNLVVTPKTPPVAVTSKYHVKWSQRPDVINDHDPKMIRGWDQPSNYYWKSIVADDWKCEDERPVTDIHWWGSFLGWAQPYPPAIVPKAFHIGIWTDVPVGADPNPAIQYSHPGYLIWENICESWVWNFFGYDQDPREEGEIETCFQFNQLLSEDEWFHQEPEPTGQGRVYWLSIAAIYNTNDHVEYPWGWKTRQPHWNDDAVSIYDVETPPVDYPANFPPPPSWPPVIGSQWIAGMPIEYPTGSSWDVAFELTTNEPAPNAQPSADLYPDGIVNFKDLAILANQWLTTGQ